MVVLVEEMIFFPFISGKASRRKREGVGVMKTSVTLLPRFLEEEGKVKTKALVLLPPKPMRRINTPRGCQEQWWRHRNIPRVGAGVSVHYHSVQRHLLAPMSSASNNKTPPTDSGGDERGTKETKLIKFHM